MDFTVWDILIGILSWSVRLLFWPLGIVIKYREFFGTTLPYFFLGLLALIVGTAALGPLGGVLRGVIVCSRGIHCLCGSSISAFRLSRKEEPKGGGDIHPEPTEDPNNPCYVLGISRDATQDELDARYRQLLRTNHPDMVAHLDPVFQALATERSQQIIKAYEALLGKLSTKE